MDIKETQSHYEKLGAALRAFIQGFDRKGPLDRIKQEMERILVLAAEIGEPLKEDTQELKEAFNGYLKKRSDPHVADRLLERALRLEQETREI